MNYPDGFPYQQFTVGDFESITKEKYRGNVVEMTGRIPGGDVIVAVCKINRSFPRRQWIAYSVRFLESKTHDAIAALEQLYRVDGSCQK